MIQRNGYTSGMKTAVSLPDDLFKGAENLRRRLKISRSEVYRRAIAEYLLRHSPDQIREALDQSRLRTVVCVPLTSNLRWAEAPGNTLLRARGTGLPKDSVANVTQLVALDKESLTERVGRLSESALGLLFSGIDLLFGRG